MTLLIIIGVLYISGVLYVILKRHWYLLVAVHVLIVLIGAMLVFGIHMLIDERQREAATAIDTTDPTTEQIEYCRRGMHLDPAVVIQPIGFSMQPRGQDKSVFFKFRARNINHLFMPGVVDLDRLEKGRFAGVSPTLGPIPEWWDVDKAGSEMLTVRAHMDALGDSLDEMTIGIVGEAGNYVVYIHWSDG